MRVEDLERRLDMLGASKKENGCGASAFPNREIKAGRDYPFATLSGDGVTSLIVKITATVYDCGSLRLALNGVKVAQAEFPFLGNDEKVIVASVRLGGPAALTLTCENGLFALVRKVEAVAFGADVSLSPFFGGFGAVDNGGRTGVAYCENDRLIFAAFDSSTGKKIAEKVLGGGTCASVAARGENGFAVVYRDGFGGLWGVCVDGNGVAGKRTFLGAGGDFVSVAACADGLAVACVRGGKVYVLYTDSDFGSYSGESEIYFPFAADGVSLCGGGDRLALVVGSNGKIFLKESVSGVSARASVRTEISARVF